MPGTRTGPNSNPALSYAFFKDHRLTRFGPVRMPGTRTGSTST